MLESQSDIRAADYRARCREFSQSHTFVSIRYQDIFDFDGVNIVRGKMRVSQLYGFNEFSHWRHYRCIKSNQIYWGVFHAQFWNWLYWLYIFSCCLSQQKLDSNQIIQNQIMNESKQKVIRIKARMFSSPKMTMSQWSWPSTFCVQNVFTSSFHLFRQLCKK